MKCPNCGSTNVVEVDNLTCEWACGDCGHTDDGAEFTPVCDICGVNHVERDSDTVCQECLAVPMR